jgi:hypothetical protein
MRHDPASAAVVIMLRGLKMYGMAQAVDDLIEQGAPAFEAAVPILSQLLKAEMPNARSGPSPTRSRRPVPGLQGSGRVRLRPARSTRPWSASSIAASSSMAPRQCRADRRPRHRQDPYRHRARRPGVEHHRKKVRFFSTVDLVNALEQEKAMNKAGQLAERLLRLDLVILDELGYLPFSPSGGRCCSIC